MTMAPRESVIRARNSSTRASVQGASAKRLIDDRWVLEVCLDSFAIGVDMPLQALNLNAKQDVARDLYSSSLASVTDFDRLIAGVPLDFHEVSTWWQSNRSIAGALYPIIDKNLYMTSGCYTNPLIKSFRQHHIWKFWESVLLLRALEGDGRREFPRLAGHGMLSDLFGGGFSVAQAGIFIVSWPIKRFRPATHMGEYVTIGDALVDGFLEVLRKADETPRLGRESLERFANLRAAITEADLSHRLGIARTAFEGLADLPAMPEMIMGRPNLTSIASALVFAAIMQELDQLRQFDVLDKKGGAKLLHRLRATAPATEASAFATWYENPPKRLRANIVPRCDIDWEKQGQTAQLAIVGEGLQPVSAGDDLEKLDRIYSWFLDSVHTRRNAYDYEISLVLRSWCRENVGDLLAVAQTALSDNKKGSKARVADAIAQDVAQALSADMGTVISYRRMDGVAVLIGFYCADPEISAQTREYLEARFYEIADDPAKRSQSMSYRVMQTGEPEACFSLDHATGAAMPPNSTMLSLPDDLSQIVSQNSAPISVFGRPWGVISVGGLRPFQFSSNAATTLSDLASFYSSFIFYHWMLANIDGMNSLVVDPSLSRGTKYEGLCAHVCNLLLADSASIWAAHVVEEDRFDLVAWTNRPDLDCALAELNLDRKTIVDNFYSEAGDVQSSWPFFFDRANRDRSSGAAEVARHEQAWIQGTLHQGLFSGEWFDKEHTRGLRDSDFKTICIIPVRAAGILRGFITLLNKSSRFYQEHWREVMRIISEEVGLMIQSIEIQTTLQQNLFRPLRHEVRPAVNGLRERISKLDRLSRRLEIRDNHLFRDFHLVQSDIVRNAEELELRVNSLLDQGQTRNPASTADIILEDAKLRATHHKGATEDLHAHFNEIGNSLPRQRQKPHRFIYRGPRSLNINIEAGALREILRNLMDNAAKYCVPHDEIVGQVRETDNHVEFSLSNIGPELSLQEKTRIFQKGFRGAQARRDDPTGIGLGLYYSRELCRLYGITLHYTQRRSGMEGMSRHSFELLIPISRVERT